MYIDLFGSSDRLGGNIVDLVSQILYGIHNNFYIVYDRNNLRIYNSYNQKYTQSIFMQILFDIVDEHNSKIKMYNLNDSIDLAAPTHFEVLSKTVLSIQQDLFSYFREKIYTQHFKDKFTERGKNLNYEIPFNPKKTILVHLRLEDVRNRPDYDGTICANHFRKHIENIGVANNFVDYEIKKTNPNCNQQSPIPFERIQKKIDSILKDKPNYEVVIVTNPGEETKEIPYKVVSSSDEFYDLYLLCCSEIVVLSKSNYALSSLFFGMSKDVHIPLWGHIPCYGLYTKYDKTNFNFFK